MNPLLIAGFGAALEYFLDKKPNPKNLKIPDASEKPELYREWKALVNMSPTQLGKFLDSPEGRKAGLTSAKARALGIKYGRQSAVWILRMKKRKYQKWTPEMWRWAKRQISFISRMRGLSGSLYDKDGNKTRKHLSLLLWGHDPEK